MSYSRQEIIDEIDQFRNDNPNDEEFHSVIADYIEQVQDESAGYARREVREEPKTEATPAMALAIQIYKVMNELPLWVKSDPAQLTYALAKDLDFHYKFYNKRGN